MAEIKEKPEISPKRRRGSESSFTVTSSDEGNEKYDHVDDGEDSEELADDKAIIADMYKCETK